MSALTKKEYKVMLDAMDAYVVEKAGLYYQKVKDIVSLKDRDGYYGWKAQNIESLHQDISSSLKIMDGILKTSYEAKE